MKVVFFSLFPKNCLSLSMRKRTELTLDHIPNPLVFKRQRKQGILVAAASAVGYGSSAPGLRLMFLGDKFPHYRLDLLRQDGNEVILS